MTNSDAPKDGDFTAYLASQARKPQDNATAGTTTPELVNPAQPEPGTTRPQTVDDVFVNGEEPTNEFIEEFAALQGAEALSDEELERQALQHPGGDNDPMTPE